MNTKRYTISDAHSTQFYQLPKWLVAFRIEGKISNEALLLYTYLRDRVQLSISNKWIDDNGEAYLYFKREQMGKLLGCKKDKLQKTIKELKSVNLLDEVRQGLNLPNRLYLRYPDSTELMDLSIDFESEAEENEDSEAEIAEKVSVYAECGISAVRTSEKLHSGVRKNRSLDCAENAPNNTENNKIEYNKTVSQDDDAFADLAAADVPENFTKACIALVREVDDTPLSNVRIGKQVIPSSEVRRILHQLKAEHLQDVYRKVQCAADVRNPKAYILALLFDAAKSAPANDFSRFFNAPQKHTPSYNLKEIENFDIFDHLYESKIYDMQ